jgi:replicative DNA helicase
LENWKEEYYDEIAVGMVLGGLIKDHTLFRNPKYSDLTLSDFLGALDRILFGAISNLIKEKAETIDGNQIDLYLNPYPKQHKIYIDNGGKELINKIVKCADNFEIYYNRIKKFSFLREARILGIDISSIYSKEIIDREDDLSDEMNEKFNSMTINDMIRLIENDVNTLKSNYIKTHKSTKLKAGEKLETLIESFTKAPELGTPLYGDYITAIARGARIGKLFLRSGGTGSGKSRLAVADAAFIACGTLWDSNLNCWVQNGIPESTLFITTELSLDEIQTMLVAFVSGVSETKILDGIYTEEEQARINEAIKVINKSPLWLEQLSDFDITDIEQTVQKYVYSKDNIRYVFFDYIHTSMKLMNQMVKQSSGMKLREDNILLMFIDKLKSLCNELNIFIFTATQVNGDMKNSKILDTNVLRGAKSIGDKIDLGYIIQQPTPYDLDKIRKVLTNRFKVFKMPNLVYHVYKNRRGKYDKVRVWLCADLGNMRIEEIIVTNNNYEPIDIVRYSVENIEKLELSSDEPDTIYEAEEQKEEEELEDY